jgi:hypothetical protein
VDAPFVFLSVRLSNSNRPHNMALHEGRCVLQDIAFCGIWIYGCRVWLNAALLAHPPQ